MQEVAREMAFYTMCTQVFKEHEQLDKDAL